MIRVHFISNLTNSLQATIHAENVEAAWDELEKQQAAMREQFPNWQFPAVKPHWTWAIWSQEEVEAEPKEVAQ